MDPLTPARRRALRAQAHHLDPVVSIGHHGLTPPVLHEIDIALAAHELIKIRVHSDVRDDREAMMDRVCAELDAAPVQHLGKLLIVFRPTPASEPAVERRDRPARRARETGAAPSGRPRERRPSHAEVGERHARHRRGASRETLRPGSVAGTNPRRRLANPAAAPEPQGVSRPFDRRKDKAPPRAGEHAGRRGGRPPGSPASSAAPATDWRHGRSAAPGSAKVRHGERRPYGAPGASGSAAAQRKRGSAAAVAGGPPRARGGRPASAPKPGGAPAAVRRRRRPTGGT